MATVLLIEDEAELRELLVLQLQRRGYRVVSASGGHAALKAAAPLVASVDIVVTDIFMPEGDGIETLLALKRLASDIPVIAISGGGSYLADGERYLEAANQLGAVATLRKPFSPEALVAAISRALECGAGTAA